MDSIVKNYLEGEAPPRWWYRFTGEVGDFFARRLVERDAQVEALREEARKREQRYNEYVEFVQETERERDAARAQVEALQHKFDVATTGPVMFPEEANRLRAQVKGLREALDTLQDHHCGGMCHRDHEKVMAQVNAVMAATEEP